MSLRDMRFLWTATFEHFHQIEPNGLVETSLQNGRERLEMKTTLNFL